MAPEPLFDQLAWRDPISGSKLVPIIQARNPAGVPVCGALQIEGSKCGYPIVDCVARITPALAVRHAPWLKQLGLEPPSDGHTWQGEGTVESFGFQWMWATYMRSDSDLRWRVAQRFGLEPSTFAGKLVIDAGAGAGDQSAYLLRQRADVVSVDLSAAIDLVASKLRLNPRWVGVQGDIAALPFADGAANIVYCEGVIQHTADSSETVVEICRVVAPGGLVLATHYSIPEGWAARVKYGYVDALRGRLSRLNRYKLLLVTGALASSAYIPLVGQAVRASRTATFSHLMPDFRTTWINTFDTFGNQAFQRRVGAEEFWSYFEKAGPFEREGGEGTVVFAKRSPASRTNEVVSSGDQGADGH